MNHGMPHFENMDAKRGPPVLSKNLMRNIGNRDQLAWKHVELIRRRWKGKLVVKGLIAPADARIARESGVDGVIVSNHGGRQLDYTVSALRTLPEIAAEANGMTVMLDGGIRRGTDVIKALALGAQFVFVGRPLLYAAVAGGEAGVRRALTLNSNASSGMRLHRDMALYGRSRRSARFRPTKFAGVWGKRKKKLINNFSAYEFTPAGNVRDGR